MSRAEDRIAAAAKEEENIRIHVCEKQLVCLKALYLKQPNSVKT
jgi:hypothetical protein